MVKPVYPQSASNDEELEGAVGYSHSSSTSQAREVLPFADNEVFLSDVRTRGESSRGFLLSTTQTHAIPTPTPRGRFRSLPEEISLGTQGFPVERRAAPSDDMPPALRDIASKGQELFWFILSEEIKSRRDQEPGSLSTLTIPASSHRMEVLSERGQGGGRTLRQIADAFAQSSQRLRVRGYAEEIDLQSLNYDSFSDLLFGLFQEGGVTQARVLVLFFFCSDVALRALRERLTQRFQQLIDWTCRYITERLSTWVFDHGGWGAVLQESFDQAFKVTVGFCSVSILACSIFILLRYVL